MAQTPRDDLSRRWLDKFNVDSGACRVFLGLRPDQQEALRRMGGLGQSHPSGVLMKRIRRSFGFVDLDTLMASDDFDQRSRSPALRIPNTKEGTSSLGGEQQGRREPQEGRHEQQGRREQQGRHEQQERREQQAGYLAEGEPGSKGGTSSIGGTSSKGGTSMNEIQGKGGDVLSPYTPALPLWVLQSTRRQESQQQNRPPRPTPRTLQCVAQTTLSTLRALVEEAWENRLPHRQNRLPHSSFRQAKKCLRKRSTRGFEPTTKRWEMHGRETSRSWPVE